ncbi:PEP-CTERM sorting domain-containing protein [Akkermansiaceae bacterium]|nr:PEP-CTERM sorting domain-containing protein [Akkermansiaceae bacterium]MDB4373487.1 PEP-CTERM sorting domain-containing protein [Akkermansiaceae bacterium]
MTKTLSILSSSLILIGTTQAATVAFSDFGTALTDTATNGMLADGAATSLTVTGVANGNNYIYSVTYTGASYDGDATNDTLSFDILVEGWSGGTITSPTTSGANNPGNQFSDGTATIGTTDSAVFLSANGFSVSNAVMTIGQTIQLSMQNLSVTTSTGAYQGNLLAFIGLTGVETAASFGHQAVIGSGSNLQGLAFNNTTPYTFANPVSGTLSVSSGTTPAGSNPQRWRMDDIRFEVEVSPIPEPSAVTMLLGTLGLLTLRRRR